MRKCPLALLSATALFLASTVAAQTPPPAPPPAATAAPAAPAAPNPYHQAGMDFTFTLDGYADKNFNNPPSGFNGLRNFDLRSNTAHFNMGMMTVDHGPDPVGFHLDVGFGQVFSFTHSSDRAPEGLKYFKQAYIDFKPKSWKGVQIDVGEFVTSAGAEVIESNLNFNYTRSLLFAWAIPYYHFGVRATVPVGKFTGGLQVVQGWNNVYDNNSGKTVGITGAYAWKKVTWSNVYYVGPEKAHTNDGIRHLFDTVVAVNQTDNLSYYVNFDYGRDKNIGPGASSWVGLAAAMRYAFAKNYAFALRGEWFDDKDGFSTGTAQQLKEVTVTGEYKLNNWLITRAEFRSDFSDKPFFEKQHQPDGGRVQPTILLGVVAFFGPKK